MLVRDTVRLEVLDLDALIGPDHPARPIWAYAERVDVSAFDVSRRSARAIPVTPRPSSISCWLHGSTRSATRLVVRGKSPGRAPTFAYSWRRGEFTVNHDARADFRPNEPLCLDDLRARP